jgi:hypothetical protein
MTYEEVPDSEAQAEAKPAMKNGILAARSEARLGDHHEAECDSRPNYPRLQARAAQAPSKPAGAGHLGSRASGRRRRRRAPAEPRPERRARRRRLATQCPLGRTGMRVWLRVPLKLPAAAQPSAWQAVLDQGDQGESLIPPLASLILIPDDIPDIPEVPWAPSGAWLPQ